MAKNIKEIAEALGAEIVGQVPKPGGGALGAAKVAHDTAALSAAAGAEREWIGAMREDAELLDGSVEEAMRRRRLQAWCPARTISQPWRRWPRRPDGRSTNCSTRPCACCSIDGPRSNRVWREDLAVGMFDHMTCELPMPDGRDLAKDSFQTKSLECLMDLYTITAAGRLIYHKRRYSTSRMPEPIADIDMNYHGDIEIYAIAGDGKLARYAVRFTRGTLEWIRTFDALRESDYFLPADWC
jgi:hypothetical protein